MIGTISIILAGIFLPLFPMSMVFNAVLDRISHHGLRALLLMIWPLFGLTILLAGTQAVPGWLVWPALFTSALYAIRMLSLRDINQWSGFLATSLWSLLWLPATYDTALHLLYVYALSMSVPLVFLVFLAAGLEQRFGAAYIGLYGGLARTIPRFSGILVAVVMTAVATPLAPTFFIMLDMVVETVSATPYAAILLLLVWLFWSWAGALLIQGLIVGRPSEVRINDMDIGGIMFFALLLLALIAFGLYLSGVIL